MLGQVGCLLEHPVCLDTILIRQQQYSCQILLTAEMSVEGKESAKPCCVNQSRCFYIAYFVIEFGFFLTNSLFCALSITLNIYLKKVNTLRLDQAIWVLNIFKKFHF